MGSTTSFALKSVFEHLYVSGIEIFHEIGNQRLNLLHGPQLRPESVPHIKHCSLVIEHKDHNFSETWKLVSALQ